MPTSCCEARPPAPGCFVISIGTFPDESIVVFHVTDSSYAKEQQEDRRAHPRNWDVRGF